jgi:hypothetical protein
MASLYAAIAKSDDYRAFKDVFADAARRLIELRRCSMADFQEWGGWTRSFNFKPEQVYFIHCGGKPYHVSRRWYLRATTGELFQKR